MYDDDDNSKILHNLFFFYLNVHGKKNLGG